MKKKNIIVLIICLLLIGCFLGIYFLSKNSNKQESANLIELTGSTFKEKIENKDSFILLVTKEGCSHCAEYLPVFINVIDKYDITAYKLDLATLSSEEKSYLADIANISGTPTTVFIEKGEEETTLNRIVGSANRKTIETRLKTLKYIK